MPNADPISESGSYPLGVDALLADCQACSTNGGDSPGGSKTFEPVVGGKDLIGKITRRVGIGRVRQSNVL